MLINALALLPSLITLLIVLATLFATARLLNRNAAASQGYQFRNQLIMLALTAAGALLFILVIPIGDAKRGQLLSLIGIVVSASIALSSTTFLGNAMAGVMLRAVRSFTLGDFIRTGEHFGRVSERGLFHTEIQTPLRDLTTLPNLFLVTHPVTTVRSSGTIVSTGVSLGYDVSRHKVEKLLLEAAAAAELTDPYVLIKELGDFSVQYRVHGLLSDVKQIVTVRSRLRGAVLDHLHEGGVEIVSPTFMNQRVQRDGRLFIPEPAGTRGQEPTASSPEAVVFDKADEAESIQALHDERSAIAKKLAELKERIKRAGVEDREPLETESTQLTARSEELEAMIAERSSQAEDR